MPDLLYLSSAEVSTCGVSMAEVIAAVEQAYAEKGAGRTEAPPKLGVHLPPPDSFIHAMPAYVPSADAAGVKWVSSFPGNRGLGLPSITGVIVLSDTRTGLPFAILDGSWVTTMRTGAVTAVAARRLARPESSTVAVLGCGVQGRSNVLALREVLPLRRVRAFDTHPAAAERYAEEMATTLGASIETVATAREAVAGADVVVTAGTLTLDPPRTIRAGWLEPGAFLATVDYDSSVHPDALAELDLYCTDDIPQLEAARERGYFRAIPPLHADLGELVACAKPGRTTPAQRTGISHLGLAICDVAVGALVARRAAERGLGTRLPL